MMGYMWGGNNMMYGGVPLLGALTWILLVIFLILGSLFFWKKLNEDDKPDKK